MANIFTRNPFQQSSTIGEDDLRPQNVGQFQNFGQVQATLPQLIQEQQQQQVMIPGGMPSGGQRTPSSTAGLSQEDMEYQLRRQAEQELYGSLPGATGSIALYLNRKKNFERDAELRRKIAEQQRKAATATARAGVDDPTHVLTQEYMAGKIDKDTYFNQLDRIKKSGGKGEGSEMNLNEKFIQDVRRDEWKDTREKANVKGRITSAIDRSNTLFNNKAEKTADGAIARTGDWKNEVRVQFGKFINDEERLAFDHAVEGVKVALVRDFKAKGSGVLTDKDAEDLGKKYAGATEGALAHQYTSYLNFLEDEQLNIEREVRRQALERGFDEQWESEEMQRRFDEARLGDDAVGLGMRTGDLTPWIPKVVEISNRFQEAGMDTSDIGKFADELVDSVEPDVQETVGYLLGFRTSDGKIIPGAADNRTGRFVFGDGDTPVYAKSDFLNPELAKKGNRVPQVNLINELIKRKSRYFKNIGGK